MNDTRNNKRKHVILLSLLAVGMLGFAYALVPLYEVFCEVTGLNGKNYGRTIDPAVAQVQAAPSNRIACAMTTSSEYFSSRSPTL